MRVQRWRIHGRVQGVGYRWYMIRQARLLGVTGFVRNRMDGSVEALVAGPEAELEALLDWARQGPALAGVTAIDISPASGEELPADFSERPTL